MSIKKVFAEDAVTIVTASSVSFLPYVAVLIKSIICNRTNIIPYDIIVVVSDRHKQLEDCILEENKQYTALSIRFIDAKDVLPNLDCFSYGHFSKETYYKLFVPFLCGEYERILFLDSDTIVQRDVSELFFTELGTSVIGAVLDVDSAGLYNGAMPHKKEYVDEVLRLKNPYMYFQAGVLLYNIDQWKHLNLNVEKMSRLVESRQWELLDQDIANVLYERKVFTLSMNWNVLTDCKHYRIANYIMKAPDYLQNQYFQARECPYIIHYAGSEKPWDNPEMDYGGVFWKYARTSSVYEIILFNSYDKRIKEFQKNTKKIKVDIKRVKYIMRETLIYLHIIKRYKI